MSISRLIKRALSGGRPSEPIKFGQSEPELPKDEFIQWLSYANPGMLVPGNLVGIQEAVQHLPSEAPIIEIGSFAGLSTNYISYFKRRFGRRNRLITCDRWEFEKSPGACLGESSIPHSAYREFVRESYMRNVKFFSGDDLPYTVEMFSDEFFAAWQARQAATDVFGRGFTLGGPISFAYIDGNHRYEFAKRDFLHVHASLEKGGYILFDDSGDSSGWEVCEVIKELKAMPEYQVVRANPNYLVRRVA